MFRLRAIIAVVVLAAITGIFAKPLLSKEPVKPTLPSAASEHLKKNFPGAEITAVVMETESGQQVYDVETEEGEINRDFIFDLYGTLIEVGTHIEVGQVLPAVSGAALAAYPNAKIVAAEHKVVRGEERYDLEMKDGGRLFELFVSPLGTLLSVQDDEDDADEDDDK